MPQEKKTTNGRLLAELNDARSDYKYMRFLTFLSFISFFFFIFIFLLAMTIAIVTSIMHYDATTVCLWLGWVGPIGAIIAFILWQVSDEIAVSHRGRIRNLEEQYELATDTS